MGYSIVIPRRKTGEGKSFSCWSYVHNKRGNQKTHFLRRRADVVLPFDFEYHQPDTLKEAVELFQALDQKGLQPMYFSGGTELITLGRINLTYAGAVVDIKKIPEFLTVQTTEGHLILGSALTLTKVEETNAFPLLTKTASEVADHTARGKITLGGNICAQIFYREAVLPFLLAESEVVLAGSQGIRTVPINEIFYQELQLKRGEVLVQLVTDRRAVEAPFISIKRRQQWETGYPLITIAGLKADDMFRVAVSGLCPFPFRSQEIESLLNNRQISLNDRIKRVIEVLPQPILSDVEGSADYRIFVLKNLLLDVMNLLGE
jgi:CO/xanthine dehydrogenase FAD-binding subunit